MNYFGQILAIKIIFCLLLNDLNGHCLFKMTHFLSDNLCSQIIKFVMHYYISANSSS